MNFGQTFKYIRENKNLSQKELTKNIITQGAYSNFESLNTDIKISTFYKLLDRLALSPEEFDYILHNYNYSVRNSLLQRYSKLPLNQTKLLIELMNDIKAYIKHTPNELLQDILTICEALLLFNSSNDKKTLQPTLHIVWTHMEKKDELYLTDIYLLNSSLFFFPLETALNLRDFLFRSIERYKNFQNIEKMKLTINLNISLMYLEEKLYGQALNQTEECILQSKQFFDYIRLPFCYYRKGICLMNLGEDGEPWIEKAIHILKVLERDDLIPLLEAEKDRYLKE